MSPSDAAAAPPYAAIVLGATGNVGRSIVSLLLADPALRDVAVLNRRASGDFAGEPKVREVVVQDMNDLQARTAVTARTGGATLAFCAIGVGKGSRKMPPAEVRKIEVQYPAAFARGCKAGGVLALGVLTAAGADSRSSIEYIRVIGEKEDAVIGAGLPVLGIYKPSVIIGNSNTPNYLRYLFPAIQWALPSSFHAIHTDELARAMVVGTLRALAGLRRTAPGGATHAAPVVARYEYKEMKLLFRGDRDEI